MLALSSAGFFGVFGRSFGFGGRGYMMPHAFGYDGYGAFFPFLGLIKLIVGIGLLALIVYLVVKVSKGELKTGTESRKALEILKERYARGEITEDEFKKMKEEILS